MNEPRHDVLNGWKEIASYLGRDPRTVERWEKQRSLPVRRLPGSGRASVYALKPELDEWLASSPARSWGAPELPPAQVDLLPNPDRAPMYDTADLPQQGAGVPELETEDVPLASTPPGASHWFATSRPWRWGGFALGAVCCLTLAGLGWHHAHRPALPVSAPTARVSSGAVSRMVPSSKVPGVEELYLRACYQSEQRTPDSLHRALENFEAAIAKDAAYAPAYAGLASTYVLLREYSIWSDQEAFTKAKAAAQHAIALDPELPQAHAELGFVEYFWDWDPPAAEAEFRTALRLDPGLPLAHHWFGSMLTHEGRFQEAIPELRVAQRLNPSSGAILTMYALALGLSGERGRASDLLQEAISNEDGLPDRNPATMHNVLGLLSLMRPADFPRYFAETTRAAELRGDTRRVTTLRLAESVYKAHGEQAMWRTLLQDERRRHTDEPTYDMARYEARLGANEQALTHLTVLAARHDPQMIGISIDPMFSELRREPRFKQIRTSMRLPPMSEPI